MGTLKQLITLTVIPKKGQENMTPKNKIKREILLDLQANEPDLDYGPMDSDEAIEEAYERLDGEFDDLAYEFREGDVETDVPAPTSRHYESKSVARQMVDGTWVGWTYWYGGGKHGESEAIKWMDDAYDLDCKEEEKMVVVRTFTVVEKQREPEEKTGEG